MTGTHDVLKSRCYDLYGGPIAFNEWCRLSYRRSAPDGTSMDLPWSPRIATPSGAIGPGMVATLIDAVAGQTAIAAFDWGAQVATVSMAVSLLAPVPAGAGLRGTGRAIHIGSDSVVADVRVASDAATGEDIAIATVRMMAVKRMERPDTPGVYPPLSLAADGYYLGADHVRYAQADSRLVAEITPAHHFMGNTMRRALHGGFVAAVLLETLQHLGEQFSPAFVLRDGQVAFRRTALDLPMRVEALTEHAGKRVAFAKAELQQAGPDGEAPRTIATLAATFGRDDG